MGELKARAASGLKARSCHVRDSNMQMFQHAVRITIIYYSIRLVSMQAVGIDILSSTLYTVVK